MNNFRSFLMLPPNLLDQWRNVLGLGSSAGSANKKLRRKAARKVLIEHRAHSGWQLEAGEKIFVNAPAPMTYSGSSPTLTWRMAESPSAAPSGSSSCRRNGSFGAD